MTTIINPLLDAPAVSELLKCSRRTVEDHARSGRLPAVKFGDGWLFPAEALLRAINRMAETEAAQRAKTPSASAVATATQKPARRAPPTLIGL